MRVKFLEDHQYETEGRNAGPTFKEGEVKDFRDDIAERFIRRGVAVEAGGAAKPGPAAAQKPAQEPPPKQAADPKKDEGGGAAKPGDAGNAPNKQ